MNIQSTVKYLIEKTPGAPSVVTDSDPENGTVTWVEPYSCRYIIGVRHRDGSVFLWDDIRLKGLECETEDEALDIIGEDAFESYMDSLNGYWG